MKIALIPQPLDRILPPEQTSIGIWSFEVAQRLGQRHEVAVFSGRPKESSDSLAFEYEYSSPKLDRMLTPAWDKLRQAGIVRQPLFGSSFHYSFYANTVARQIKNGSFDIVHLHNLSQFVPTFRKANPNAIIILHMHCEWLSQLDRKTIARRLALVNRIAACSDFVRDTIRRTFPEFAARCVTIHNGVEVRTFTPDHHRNGDHRGEQIVLFVGRISPEKGLHVLLQSFVQITEKYPEAKLMIVGPHAKAPAEFILTSSSDDKVQSLEPWFRQDYLNALKQQVPDYLKSRIIFTGPAAYRNLVHFYRRAQIFVAPSVWDEPFGMPIIEAMASGVPVIGTRGGGITEIIAHQQTGFLVERNNVVELSAALSRLLNDKERRQNMGRAARQRAEKLFSWESVTERLHELYEECLYEKGKLTGKHNDDNIRETEWAMPVPSDRRVLAACN